jgi:nucleoside 2-deoxyribosyltransferase
MIANGVYLAGRYSRKNELRECAAELEACDYPITSSWLKEHYDPNVQLKEITDEDNRKIAEQDVFDIERAEAMVFFAEDQDAQPPRGGRHVELGYALALGLKLFVIGAKENIFHFLPCVKVYPTWRDFMLAECFG